MKKWMPLQEASELYDKAVEARGGSPSGPEMSREFCEALAAGKFGAIGVRVDAQGDDKAPESIPAYHFNCPRTFRYGLIEAWSDETSMEEFAEARNKRNRHPDWQDVAFNAGEFVAWLSGDSAPEPAQLLPVKRLGINDPELIAAFKEFQPTMTDRDRRGQIRDWCKREFPERLLPKTADALDKLDAESLNRKAGRPIKKD
jgi:hypothetical protein